MLMALLLVPSITIAGDVCQTGVRSSSVFLSTGYPGYMLFQAPQLSYQSGPVGTTYETKKHDDIRQEISELKAMMRAYAAKGLADGTISAESFATINQPLVNRFCVGCHSATGPGKSFAMTDITKLTGDQHKAMGARILSDDPATQMPPAGSQQAKAMSATDASLLLRELLKSRSAEPVQPPQGVMSQPPPK
jgi:mono/diheme cytochrome c family protein